MFIKKKLYLIVKLLTSIILHLILNGGPGGTWTPDKEIMSLLLWPTELQALDIEWKAVYNNLNNHKQH